MPTTPDHSRCIDGAFPNAITLPVSCAIRIPSSDRRIDPLETLLRGVAGKHLGRGNGDAQEWGDHGRPSRACPGRTERPAKGSAARGALESAKKAEAQPESHSAPRKPGAVRLPRPGMRETRRLQCARICAPALAENRLIRLIWPARAPPGADEAAFSPPCRGASARFRRMPPSIAICVKSNHGQGGCRIGTPACDQKNHEGSVEKTWRTDELRKPLRASPPHRLSLRYPDMRAPSPLPWA